MPYPASAAGRASALNWGLARERAIVRTSTTRLHRACCNSNANSAIDRVECPMV